VTSPDSAAGFDRVEVDKVSKVYGRKPALSGVSVALEGGRVAALLGDNGAGKSTLIGILSTLTRPTSGRVLFGDATHAAHGERGHGGGAQLRAQIGLCAHESLLYGDLTALENLELYAKLYGLAGPAARARAAATRVGLAEEAMLRQVRTYSRGMTQRLALARTLLHDPQLVLLDEPFTGLDQGGQAWLTGLIRELGAAGRVVVVVTHDLAAIAGVVDHVIVLARGRVAVDESKGTPFSHDELTQAYARAASRAAERGLRAPVAADGKA
jgi:heme exporter protein A